MPLRTKERYNAKARQSSVGGSSHKKRRKIKAPREADIGGSNTFQIDPEMAADRKDAERQRRELLAQHDPSMLSAPISSKKRKRLDAYISRQLKKENRQKLMSDLAKSSAQVSDRSTLMTAATLGTGKILTGMERINQDVAKEERAQTKKKGLHHYTVVDEDFSQSSEEEEGPEKDILGEHVGEKGSALLQDRRLPNGIDGLPITAKIEETSLIEEQGKGAMKKPSQEKHNDEHARVEDEESDSGNSIEEEDDSEGEDDSDEEDSSDEDGDEEEAEGKNKPSRRRGLPQTQRSLGFKDWAREALGIGGGPKIEEQDNDVYKGPEPVAGLITKVKDLMDGTFRGPLGEREVVMKERSAFAQKYYEELKEKRSNMKDGEITKDRVVIHRTDEIQQGRMMLPVLAEEETIVRTIMENMVTILCGETGSGKTTQVPQFLYEVGFGTQGSCNPGMVGITQPRRVAALSMAARVAKEMNLPSSKVSHQIRYDATVSSLTSIKFMTDGVLLRELAVDFLLTKYSVIIIDEAHERSVNTDVLIGVLSRVVKSRAKRWMDGQGQPLRMVIMSATLRVDDFANNSRLFNVKPPIIEIDARQYPVVNHFNRKTSHDYVTESVKKASKIHARLPPGGILIFLTGQAEISTVCRKLEKRYGKKSIQARLKQKCQSWKLDGKDDDERAEDDERVTVAARNGDVEAEEIDLTLNKEEDNEEDLALDIDNNNGSRGEEDEEALDTEDEEEEEEDYDASLPDTLRDDSTTPMHILPLYSLLPSDKQMRVFEPPPPNARLVVVATNVAETSLTIPGITYVVDCGRSKERRYDSKTGIQSFEVGFISKASANQRAGRAGRTGPGHCYRLYSSNVYEEHFTSFAQAEILRTPVDNLVLMMKAMNIDNVSNFPFPTAPNRESLQRAEKLLLRLGALEVDASGLNKSNFKVTDLGRMMSLFPLQTRLSKLLVQGHQFDCLPFVIALVAALSVGSPFVKEESLHETQDDIFGKEDEQLEMPLEAQHLHNPNEVEKQKRIAKRAGYFKVLHQLAALSGALSDPLRLLSAVGAYEHAGGTLEFCRQNHLVPKMMQEIHKLRAQLVIMVQANAEAGIDWSFLSNPKFEVPPTSKQMTILRQFLASAFIDQVAIRADLAPEGASRVPMLQEAATTRTGQGDYRIAKQFQHQLRNGAKMKSTRDVAYLAMGIPKEACFIHRSSVLFHQPPPEWIIYSDVFKGRPSGDSLEVEGKNWLKGVTKINPNWIYKLGKPLCSFSKTIEVDQRNTKERLIEAAQEIKKRQGKSNSFMNEREILVVPTYGNGPAFDIDERSSHVGWDLPAITAKQRLIGGRWVTEIV